MSYTLQKTGNFQVLKINGEPTVCPFRTQAPVQDNYGRLQIISQACDSRCPMFVVEPKMKNKATVKIECGGNSITIDANIETEKNSLDLVK